MIKPVWAFLLAACLFAGGCSREAAIQADEVRGGASDGAMDKRMYPISRKFVLRESFEASTALRPYVYSGKPWAGVVNHHSLAMDTIAKFFKTIKKNRPEIDIFVIISPDHFMRGRGASTQRLPYVTPAGEVKVDAESAAKFIADGVWDGSPTRAFEDEHGVGALVPSIAREFPEAKILPLFLPSDMDEEEGERLGKILSEKVRQNAFVIVSSDMSHFMPASEAAKRDVETLRWFERNDWSGLLSATDKNTDSSSGYAVLRSYLQAVDKDGSRFVLLDHKNSSDYVGDAKNTTSYIIGFWE